MFAQKVYPQQLGNGNLTIAQAGCLVTSFSNLLSRYGEGVDPFTLNNFFKTHNTYIGADDLGWSSVNTYDNTIVVKNVGSGGLPDSIDAVVKFHYNSVETGQPTDHFCLVDSIDNGQLVIVDSWDGQIKGPGAYESVYHKPIAWASYVKNIPAPAFPYTILSITPFSAWTKYPVSLWHLNYYDWDSANANVVGQVAAYQEVKIVAKTQNHPLAEFWLYDVNEPAGYISTDMSLTDPTPVPVPVSAAPPKGALPVPVQTSVVTIQNTIMYFISATDALNHSNAKGTVSYGKYTLYDTSPDGMLYINKNVGDPKFWVNPADDVAPPKQETQNVPIISQSSPTVATTSGIPTVTQVKVSTFNPTQWRETYKPFYPADPSRSIMYEANLDFTIQDLGGQRLNIQVPEDKRFGIYGTFTGPDGVKYFRAKMNYDVNFEYWYGIPVKHPETGFSYIVPVSLFLVLPKPVQNLWAIGMGSAERYFDNVKTKFRKVKK